MRMATTIIKHTGPKVNQNLQQQDSTTPSSTIGLLKLTQNGNHAGPKMT